MNFIDGLSLFLALLLFAGCVSFAVKWSYGTVNDAVGLFAISGIALSIIFPAFIANDIYNEAWVGTTRLMIPPLRQAVEIPTIAAGQAAENITVGAAGRIGEYFGAVGNYFASGLEDMVSWE
jgi:hypothetical protein